MTKHICLPYNYIDGVHEQSKSMPVKLCAEKNKFTFKEHNPLNSSSQLKKDICAEFSLKEWVDNYIQDSDSVKDICLPESYFTSDKKCKTGCCGFSLKEWLNNHLGINTSNKILNNDVLLPKKYLSNNSCNSEPCCKFSFKNWLSSFLI